MESSVGILAFGSLIANPGWEIEEAIVFAPERTQKVYEDAGKPTTLGAAIEIVT
jgi:hypothetical protein